MSKLSLFVGAIACVPVILVSGTAFADAAVGPSGLKIVQRIAGPDGGWDYASFDAARRRVYVAHGMQVVSIDADTGAVTPAFAQGNHLHAVTPVPGTDRIVTTNSGDNTAKILDATTGALIASVPTADDADSALYDPASGEVLIVGGDSGQIDFLDPKAAKVTASIKSGGKLEFLALDGHGKLFVNDEGKHTIVVIDLASKTVKGAYNMPGCVSPTGLAYVTGGRLVAACANGVAEIVDAASGKIIASPKIGARPDAVIYDEGRKLAYIPSGGAGTLSVIALSGAGDNTVIDTVATQVGARTGAVDPKTGRIYLPSAEYLPPTGPGQRPSVKPGSFKVLVLDRS
jgi:DNA-binding beta-propeller fold protein YncE